MNSGPIGPGKAKAPKKRQALTTHGSFEESCACFCSWPQNIQKRKWLLPKKRKGRPRGAGLSATLHVFAPDKQAVLASRTRLRTLLTIERTCPAGASWSLPLRQPSNCYAIPRAGVFKRFAVCKFHFRQSTDATPGSFFSPKRSLRGS